MLQRNVLRCSGKSAGASAMMSVPTSLSPSHDHSPEKTTSISDNAHEDVRSSGKHGSKIQSQLKGKQSYCTICSEG
jgi:hypothetical protein